MAAPNIVNVSTIIGNTAVMNVTTSATDIVTNSAASNKVFKINSLIISNIDGAAAADITASVIRTSASFALASTIAVPADASLIVISKDNSIYLLEGDSIRLTASANGDLQAVCSYEELS
jgi:uncharacterized protein YajQ (UPF0234 family)